MVRPASSISNLLAALFLRQARPTGTAWRNTRYLVTTRRLLDHGTADDTDASSGSRAFRPWKLYGRKHTRQEASGGLPDLYLSLKQERLERNLFLLSQTNTLI